MDQEYSAVTIVEFSFVTLKAVMGNVNKQLVVICWGWKGEKPRKCLKIWDKPFNFVASPLYVKFLSHLMRFSN